MSVTFQRGTLLSYLLVAIVAGVAVRMYLPKRITTNTTIPVIVTKYDTVAQTPKWLADSIKIWKKKVYSTDTIPLVINHTIIDTQFVPVGDTTNHEVANIWPILSYHSKGGFGDTAIVTNFSLRSGKAIVSKVFVTGYLTDLTYRDSSNIPVLSFKDFPPTEKHGWFYPVKHILFGAMAGITIYSVVK